MKYLLFIFPLFYFPFGAVFAQESAAKVFQLNNIPEKGITLDKGWKFKAGDNADWANPDFIDKNWISIDPTSELHHLPVVKDAGIGWFRLKMQVDSQLLGKTVAFVISILGASEIYVNGQMVYRFGNVSADFKKETTRFFTNQISGLKLGNDAIQYIAVRYSFNKKNLYLKFSFPRPLVKIVFKDIREAFEDHKKDDSFDSTLRSIEVSFYLPLGFLLLFLYFSFKRQREYFYSGIFCFCMFAAILIHIFALLESTTVYRSNVLLLITQVLYIIGALSFINAIYILYNRKRSWFFYLIVLYGIWSIPFFFVSYDSSGLFNALFFPIINLEFLRLNLIAIRQKRKGAWILLVTSILLNLSLVLMVWFNILKIQDASALLQSISYIFPGIGLSLFYAGEFARTAAASRQRAKEVEQLSHEMIAKEIEKQQILGAQNETLEKQVEERTSALSKSLKELKETQNQLIQREKMASLGELTAGIAHEIQNPLNFVNNFSEVNKELLEEMKEEINGGKYEVVKEIADDVIYNQEKITEHGKRADAIVKGMLQHSRNNNAEKELISINKLADEYMRLAYHGLPSITKTYNINIKTDFDETIGEINIIAQDIGRVILNLLNNAFYAVAERKKIMNENYIPTVIISTKKTDDKIILSVKDNGGGIPQKVLDKIFQPFFTTKPTGQGTGLGLSLSYDIVKAHNGEISVETLEAHPDGPVGRGEGTMFVIQLPL